MLIGRKSAIASILSASAASLCHEAHAERLIEHSAKTRLQLAFAVPTPDTVSAFSCLGKSAVRSWS
jgi:hypothetical protein